MAKPKASAKAKASAKTKPSPKSSSKKPAGKATSKVQKKTGKPGCKVGSKNGNGKIASCKAAQQQKKSSAMKVTPVNAMKKINKKATQKKGSLKMTRECVYSRAYHQAKCNMNGIISCLFNEVFVWLSMLICQCTMCFIEG